MAAPTRICELTQLVDYDAATRELAGNADHLTLFHRPADRQAGAAILDLLLQWLG